LSIPFRFLRGRFIEKRFRTLAGIKAQRRLAWKIVVVVVVQASVLGKGPLAWRVRSRWGLVVPPPLVGGWPGNVLSSFGAGASWGGGASVRPPQVGKVAVRHQPPTPGSRLTAESRSGATGRSSRFQTPFLRCGGLTRVAAADRAARHWQPAPAAAVLPRRAFTPCPSLIADRGMVLQR